MHTDCWALTPFFLRRPRVVPDLSAPETLLGFDFGVRRIGVALGQVLTGHARPLSTLASAPVTQRFAQIAALIAAWQPDRLIVGLPLDEDGAPGATTTLAQRFARQLHGRFHLPVEMVDERFSTRAAQDIIAGARRPHGTDDAVAAAVILQQWLDAPRPGLTPCP